MDPDPGGPKTHGSDGSGFRSATLHSTIAASTVINKILQIKLYITSGFWPRVRARALRAPVFLG